MSHKKYIVSVIAMLIPIVSFAQDMKHVGRQETDQTKVVGSANADSTENVPKEHFSDAETTALATERGLSEILMEKQPENKDLRKSVQEKSDSIKMLTDYIRQLETSHLESKKELWDSIKVLNKENQVLKTKTQVLATLSHVVYKQCLLYPLERKYSKKFVEESLRSLEALGIRNNEKYREVCETYWDLLKKYSLYNQEVLSFLQTQNESFTLKRWNINEITKEGCKSDLERLSYYQFYKTKDIKPWKSIIYLDKVIDDLKSMLSGEKKLNEANFKDLINRVKPE